MAGRALAAATERCRNTPVDLRLFQWRAEGESMATRPAPKRGSVITVVIHPAPRTLDTRPATASAEDGR